MIDATSQSSFLARLSPTTREAILALAQTYHYKTGDSIFREGDPAANARAMMPEFDEERSVHATTKSPAASHPTEGWVCCPVVNTLTWKSSPNGWAKEVLFKLPAAEAIA